MAEEKITRFDGVEIGYIITDTEGNRTAYDFPSRQILGKYEKAYDHTIEFPSRKVVSRGDTVVSFIYDKQYYNKR